MTPDRIRTAIIAYAAIALLTFGHAATNVRLPARIADDMLLRAMSGMTGAVLWPLYWSWTVNDWAARSEP